MQLHYFELKKGKKITVNWLKGAWRKIVLTVHPDKGGKHEDYLIAQSEYEYLLNKVGADFSAIEDSPENFASFDIFLASISPIVRKKFEASFPIAGEGVEVCGWWLWVGVQEESAIGKKLKEIGYKWASKKEKYYWAGIPKMSRKNWSMEQIRNCFGSKKYETDENKIEA